MSTEIKKKVTGYYDEKLEKFGTTSMGVDWNSEDSQFMRFRQLSKVLPEQTDEKFSVLDYGCGYGAYYKYLSGIYKNMHFTGFDLSEKMVEAGKALYPGPNVHWTSREPDLKPVDYVIASGIFNVKMEFADKEWSEYMIKTLHSMDVLATKGFSFNALTSYSDPEYMKSNLFYPDPRDIFDYCKKNFSKQVAILHDYPLYEFSVIVRK